MKFFNIFALIAFFVSLKESSACDRISKVEDPAHKINVSFEPHLKDKPFKDLEGFLKAVTIHPHFSLEITRCLSKVADTYKLNIYGFSFKEGISPQGDFCFYFKANKDASDPPAGETLLLTQPYTPQHWFTEILSQNTAQERYETKHAISFITEKGNYLIIPRGAYVSMYDFSQKATLPEITGFWKHVYLIKQRLDAQGKKYFLDAHTGSHGFQTVPHFHLRFTLL